MVSRRIRSVRLCLAHSGPSGAARKYVWCRERLARGTGRASLRECLRDLVIRTSRDRPSRRDGVERRRSETGATRLAANGERAALAIVDALAHAPWSAGRIGMFGASDAATSQWLIAASGDVRAEAVKAIAPQASRSGWYEFMAGGDAVPLGPPSNTPATNLIGSSAVVVAPTPDAGTAPNRPVDCQVEGAEAMGDDLTYSYKRVVPGTGMAGAHRQRPVCGPDDARPTRPTGVRLRDGRLLRGSPARGPEAPRPRPMGACVRRPVRQHHHATRLVRPVPPRPRHRRRAVAGRPGGGHSGGMARRADVADGPWVGWPAGALGWRGPRRRRRAWSSSWSRRRHDVLPGGANSCSDRGGRTGLGRVPHIDVVPAAPPLRCRRRRPLVDPRPRRRPRRRPTPSRGR